MPVPLDERAVPRLSIVAPCYNEEEGLEEFHRRMTAAAQKAVGSDYELILLNDGSSDRTWSIMADLVRRDPRLVAVNLSRRHGHQLAITAGLYTCRGRPHPHHRCRFAGSAGASCRDVAADGAVRQPTSSMDCAASGPGRVVFKRGTAALFYRLMRRVGYADMPVDAGDFRLMTRRVLDILNGMPEQHRFIRGMVSWIGLRQVPLFTIARRGTRRASNYPIAKMMGLAFDALTSFSIMPLRLASYLGLVLGCLSLLDARLHARKLGAGHVVEGWTSLLTVVLILGSTQLFLFGILGEYVGRLYLETKRRPLFVIDQVLTQDRSGLEKHGAVRDHAAVSGGI